MKKLLLPILFILIAYQTQAQGWTELDTLTGSEAFHMDRLGTKVALSTNGNTAIVSAPRSIKTPYADHGKAYILVRSGNNWNEQQVLIPPDGSTGSYFGNSADISGDGNTVVIGAPSHVINTVAKGKVYIYHRTGTTWTKQADLVNADGVQQDAFGSSVSISGDGNTVLVSSQKTTAGAASASVHVYTRSGSTWSYSTSLKSTDQVNGDKYADAVDISKDGNTAIVGAPKKNNVSIIAVGKVYIYTRAGNVWTEQKTLNITDGDHHDGFGTSVKLSADGNTAAIGAAQKTINGVASLGKIYIYTRSANLWTAQTSLVASDGVTRDYFGSHLDLSDDGNTLVTGVNGKDVGTTLSQGKVYTFTRSGTSWTEQPALFASDAKAGDFYGSTGISGDGKVLAVGSPFRTQKFDFQGKLYVYKNDLVTSTRKPQAIPSLSYYPNPTSGSVQITMQEASDVEVEVISMDGQLVEKKSLTSALAFEVMPGAAQGIYFVKITTADGASSVLKIIKE